MTDVGIGARVREAMSDHGIKQVELARRVEMAEDALSRAINGKRGFASIELARIAEVLSVDIHWLITGEPDPLAVRFVARHSYDAERRAYENHGEDADQEIRDVVELAYRQAQPWLGHQTTGLPGSVDAVREALGPDFVRSFADATEQLLGVDVLRLPGLSTAYSFVIKDRRVAVLGTNANWFRSNWDLAHEIGHLVHQDADVANNRPDDVTERRANRFAAELLLPRAVLAAVNWEVAGEDEVASFLWRTGVSTAALKNRLNALELPAPACLNVAPLPATQALLRRHQVTLPAETLPNSDLPVLDQITHRMTAAAERRVPADLATALFAGVAAGRLNPGALNWLLGVADDEAAGETAVPQPADEMSAVELMDMLGVRVAP